MRWLLFIFVLTLACSYTAASAGPVKRKTTPYSITALPDPEVR